MSKKNKVERRRERKWEGKTGSWFCSTDLDLKYQLGDLWAQLPDDTVKVESTKCGGGNRGEQDDGGVGGRGVHLSSKIHQEYTFRHRSACRTPAESRQEYLTSGKEYIEIQKNLRSSLESLKWEHWLQDPRLPENWPQGVSNSENSHKGNHWNTRPSITQPPVAPCAGRLI